MLKKHLEKIKVDYQDIGCRPGESVSYPDIAERVALAVAQGDCERGILICGTGIGMAIAANKVPGVRAACCHDVYSAERARKSNNAQIITMGGLVIGEELAKKLLDIWLQSEFGGGRSKPKVSKLDEIDEKYRKRV